MNTTGKDSQKQGSRTLSRLREVDPKTKWRIRVVVFGSMALIVTAFLYWMISMPGTSHEGPLPTMTAGEEELSERLKAHVRVMATEIGPRNTIDDGGEGLRRARDYLEGVWTRQGFAVNRHSFAVESEQMVSNLEVQIEGLGIAQEVFVIGAHYDTHIQSPGAADNASGVAIILELSRILRQQPMARTVRFVAFVNEEMPYSRSIDMGSLVYAHRARSRQENIVQMWSVETIANFSDEAGSQRHANAVLSLFYPEVGNFVAFIGNLSSRDDVTEAVGTFRELVDFPCEGLLAPPWLAGTHRSDHWSFWMMDYPGVMVTDTAPYRYDDYHLVSDTAEKLEYDHMSRVTMGLARVIDAVVNGGSAGLVF